MSKLSKEDQAKVDILMGEVHKLNDLISGEQNDDVVEQLREERMHLIALVNRIYGTEHIVEGSRITVINNDLNTD